MNDQEAYDFYAKPENREPAGPGRRLKRPNLTAITAVRFAPEVVDEVKDAATAEGVTVGAWVRRLVDRALHPEARIESRPSGTQVISARMPSALAEQLLGRASDEGVRHSEVVRRAVAVYLERPRGLIPGSGRAGEPRALPSSLALGRARTFACPHMSVGSVVSASCGHCGPLEAVA